MKVGCIRVGLMILLLGGLITGVEASVPALPDLDTTIGELPRREISLREMVETVGRECGMEVVVDERVAGDVTVERFPVTARDILDSTLPDRGYLYLVEDFTLRVMPADAMRHYFEERAESRVYGVRLKPDLVNRLLVGTDLVSTLGSLAIDPTLGIIQVHDIPCYADRVENLLNTWDEAEGLITL